MAGGYECERDGCTRAVNWLLTRISPAGTISSCDDDAAPFMIGLLATELGVDGGRLYDAIKRFVDKEAKAAAKAAADAYDAAAAQADDAQADDAQADDDASDGDAEKYWPGTTFNEDDSAVIP